MPVYTMYRHKTVSSKNFERNNLVTGTCLHFSNVYYAGCSRVAVVVAELMR